MTENTSPQEHVVPSHIIENRSLLLAYVNENPDAYPFLPVWAQADEEIYFTALGKFDARKHQGFSFPSLLMSNQEIAKKSLAIYPDISYYLADELRGNLRFASSVALTEEQSARGFLSFNKEQPELDRISKLSDREAFKEIHTAQIASDEYVLWNFEYRMGQWHGDYQELCKLVLKLVEKEGLAIAALSKFYRDREEYALPAVKNNGAAYFFLSERLRSKKEIFLEAMKRGIYGTYVRPDKQWERVPQSFRSDPDLMFAAIESSEINCDAVTNVLSKDEDFLMRLGKAGKFEALGELAKESFVEAFEANPSGEAFYQYLLAKREAEMLSKGTKKSKPSSKGKETFKL